MEIEQKNVSVWREARSDCRDGDPEGSAGGSRGRVIPGMLYALLFPVLVGALILSCLVPRRRDASGVLDSHGSGAAEIVVGALAVGGTVLVIVVLLVILVLHLRSGRAAGY